MTELAEKMILEPEVLSAGPLNSVSSPRANPALVYLQKLSPSGRSGMLSRLRKVMELVPPKGQDLPTIEAYPWRHLRYEHVAFIQARLKETGNAPSTIKTTMAAIRGVLTEAFLLSMYPLEDLERVRRIRAVSGSRELSGRRLHPGEINALFQVCSTDKTPAGARDGAILAVLYGGGLRREEAATLSVEDISLGEELSVRVIGKGNKERIVPLAAGVDLYLEDWLDIRGRAEGHLFHPINKGAKIYRDRNMSAQALFYRVEKRALQAGTRKLSPHDFRRTCTTELLERGIDLFRVQKILGHANVETTKKYDRRDDRENREAMKMIQVPYFGVRER